MAIGEVMMAQIVQYLNEMGVNPDFAVDMVKKGQNDVTHLSERRMAELRVITPLWQTSWSIEQSSQFYLYGNTTNKWGDEDHILISCADKKQISAGTAVVIMQMYVANAGRTNAATFAAGVTNYNIRLDSDGIVFDNSAKIISRRAYMSKETGRIGVDLALTLKQFELIDHSRYLGFEFYNPQGEVRFIGTTWTLDRSQLDRFGRHCLPPNTTDFTLLNFGAKKLIALQTRVFDAKAFGDNQVDHPVLPNQQEAIRMPHYRGCQFDLRMTFDGNTKSLYINRNLCASSSMGVASPEPGATIQTATTIIVNGGKSVISGLDLSPVSQKNWGRNHLSTPLLAGTSRISRSESEKPVSSTSRSTMWAEAPRNA